MEDARTSGNAQSLCHDLLMSAELLQRLLTQRLHGLGINIARYVVLRTLLEAQGAVTQTHLAEKLHLSESNLSTLVDRMSRDGLISRTRSRLDRRKSQLQLTAAGQELARQGQRVEERQAEELFQSVPAAECESLRASLRRLILNWDDQILESEKLLAFPTPEKQLSGGSAEEFHAKVG